jgi:MFS family permease
METLILGWFVLVETDSVIWLTVFGSLQFLGTLVAPIFGAVGDQVGRRTMLCLMRTAYALLAVCVGLLAVLDLLTPYHVFTIAFLAGLIRPSDLVMRNALIGDTVPRDELMKAMGISRTTMDSARMGGALIGAGLFAWLGIQWAYLGVTAIYLVGLAFTFGVSSVRPETQVGRTNGLRATWDDLRQGFGHVRETPAILATMCLAFLVNLTLYPVVYGLMPYAAREIYHLDETGLSHLVAAFAGGALLGSIAMVALGGWRRPNRVMFVTLGCLYVLQLFFGLVDEKPSAMMMLLAIGFFQSLGMVAMSVSLLHMTDAVYRGRVMGVRMLAVYALPLGLMASGVVIDQFSFPTMVALYSVVGLAVGLVIAVVSRRALWDG